MASSNQATTQGIVVWFICSLFFLYECFLRTVLGTFQSSLSIELYLTPVTFALLSSTAYSLAYGPMQIPSGLMTQRYGFKQTLFIAVCLCVLANTGFALAPTYGAAFLFRMLMGLGSSFAFVCLIVAIDNWIPRQKIATYLGLSQLIATLGPMIAAGPLHTLSETSALNWREVFVYLALMGFILAILILFLVDKNRRTANQSSTFTRLSKTKLKQFFLQKQIWYIAVFSACVIFSLEYLSENECKTFLIKKGFTPNFASYMITVGWVGYAMGCAFLGLISDKIQRRKSIMFYCALSIVVALTGIIYLPLSRLATTCCFLLLGLGTGSQSIGFTAMAERCQSHQLAIGVGFNNTMIVLFSALFPPLIGKFISAASHSSGNVTLAQYQSSFFVLIALASIAIFLAGFMIQETFGQSMRDNTLLKKTEYTYSL